MQKNEDWRNAYSEEELRHVPELKYDEDWDPVYESLNIKHNENWNIHAETPTDLYESTSPIGCSNPSKIIEEIAGNGFDARNSNYKNLQEIFNNISSDIRGDIEDRYKKFTDDEVSKNAFAANTLQNRLSDYNDSLLNFFYEDMHKRSLFLYMRQAYFDPLNTIEPYGNINRIEFVAFYWGVNWVIQNNLSSLFSKDSLQLVSRTSNYYPHFMNEVIDGFKYKDIKSSFFDVIGIGANSIHLDHSYLSSLENLNSLLALGTQARNDSSRISSLSHIHIPLNYEGFNRGPNDLTLEENTYEGSIKGAIHQGIYAILNLGNKVVENTHRNIAIEGA